TGTVPVTQDDVEAGTATVTISITANAPAGTDPAMVDASDELTIPTANTPAISLQNTPAEGSELVPGQPVSFTMTATNTGHVSLTGVAITSAMPGISDLTCDIDGHPVTQPVTLERDETLRCTGLYTITQNDLDRGQIENDASVSGSSGETTVDDA